MVVEELVALLGYKLGDDAPLRRFSASLDGVVSKAAAAARVLGAMAAVAGTAVAAGMAAVGKGVISTSAQFEKYLTTLETIEGSAESARKSLDWVADFATRTPFEVSQVMEAFVKLKSYGLDPMNGTLTTLGDTASAMGKSLEQAVEAFADAVTGEFERLKEFGIRAKQAGEEVTFTWTEGGKDMSKTVKKTASEIGKFLNETLGRRFNGAMVRQSKTWNGMVSNLSDAWSNFQRRVGDAGFFEVAKARLADMLDTLGRWADDGTIDAAAKALSSGLSDMAIAAGAVFGRLVQHTKWLGEGLASLGVSIRGVLVALGALVAWAYPTIAIFVALAVAIDDFLTYLQGGESIIGAFIEHLKVLGQSAAAAFADFSARVAEAFEPVKAFFTEGTWFEFGQRVARGLIAGIKALGGLIFSALSALFLDVDWSSTGREVGGVVGASIASFDWAGIGTAIAFGLWNGIKALTSYLAGFWSVIGEEAAKAFSEIGIKIGEALLNGLMSMSARISAWFRSLMPDWARNLFSGSGVPNTPPAPGQADVGFGPMRQRFTVDNAQSNLNRMQAGQLGGGVVNDHSQDNRQFPVTVQAPVTVNVQQATQAPAAVGNAVSSAVNSGVKAQPSRMQAGPTE